MRKLKKALALLLAAAMALVMLTACGESTPSGKEMFIQRTNEARKANGYSAVVEDVQLDKSAENTIKYWDAYQAQQITKEEWEKELSMWRGGIGTCAHGEIRLTAITFCSVSTAAFNSGEYKLSKPDFVRVDGSYIGVATRDMGGTTYIVVYMAAPLD